MPDLPTKDAQKSFTWPEDKLVAGSRKLPDRTLKQKLLAVFVLGLYLGPMIIAATLVEPLIHNEILRKIASIAIFFGGGMSVVMIFATAPSIVANLYQNRKLKQAEMLCNCYLFLVGNFSPYSYETALMYGLLAEVLKSEGKLDEAELAVRQGIEVCAIGDNLSASVTKLDDVPDNYKNLAQQSMNLAMPTKGMLYETFGSILRDKKMYKQATEAGKRAIKMIDDKLRNIQTIPKDNTRIGIASVDAMKPMQLALASTQYELALTYLAENNHEQALPLLKSARKIREEYPGTNYYLANVLSALGRAALLSEENDNAIKLANESLDLLKVTKMPVEELAKARALEVISLAKAKTGKLEEAKKLGFEATEIRQRWLPPGDPELKDLG